MRGEDGIAQVADLPEVERDGGSSEGLRGGVPIGTPLWRMHSLSNSGSQRMAQTGMSAAAIARKGAVRRMAPWYSAWRGHSAGWVADAW